MASTAHSIYAAPANGGASLPSDGRPPRAATHRDIRKTYYNHSRPRYQHHQGAALLSNSYSKDSSYESTATLNSQSRTMNSQSHLSSDSIYADLEQGLSAPPPRSRYPVYSSTRSSRKKTAEKLKQRLGYPRTTAASRPVQYRNYQSPTKTLTTEPQENPTPLMFGDELSNTTGLSQQELLRKKARHDNCKNQQSSKRHKRRSKKKAAILVNMPTIMDNIGQLRKRYYESNVASTASHDMIVEGSSLGEKPTIMRVVSNDDLEASTAETTRTGSAEYDGAHYQQQASATTPYSSVPAQQSVVNDVDGDLLLEWANQRDLRASGDTHSVGSESFPILSKHCIGNFSLSGEMSLQDDSSHRLITEEELQPVRLESMNSSEGSDRVVRFSEEAATHHYAYDSSSEFPWDERLDKRNGPELGIARREEVGTSMTTTAAVVSPSEFRTAAPFSGSSGQSSTEKPKSILKPARFSPGSKPRQYSYSAALSFPVSSMLRTERSLDSGYGTESALRPDQSISRSPPRNGMGFTDSSGRDLSPIRPAYRVRVVSADAEDGRHGKRHTDAQHATAVRDYIEKANVIYPDATVREDVSMSKYSDPPLELPSDQLDEESSVFSAANFIQAVASIVIQAAFRRYQAKERVRSMLKQKEARNALGLGSNMIQAQVAEKESELVKEQPSEKDASTPCAVNPETTKTATSPASTLDFPSASDNISLRMFTLAAIRIQSMFRGFWVRDCLAVDHYCAKIIQKTYRGHVCSSQYFFDLYRIVTVQSAWRRKLAHLHALNALAHIVTIQTAIRGFLARKSLRKLKLSKYTAYQLKEKSPNRKYVAKRLRQQSRRTHHFQARKEAAATRIQARWRGYNQEGLFIRTLIDIIVVQSVVRRWLAMKRANEMVEGDNQANTYSTVAAPSPIMSHHEMYAKCCAPPSNAGTATTFNTEDMEDQSEVNVGHTIDHGRNYEPAVESTLVQGGTKSVLSFWRDREKKNLVVQGKK